MKIMKKTVKIQTAEKAVKKKIKKKNIELRCIKCNVKTVKTVKIVKKKKNAVML